MADHVKDTMPSPSPSASAFSGITVNNGIITPTTPTFVTALGDRDPKVIAPPQLSHAPTAPHRSSSYSRAAPTLNTTYTGTLIPPDKDIDHRTLILCFDGTGDQFDADNSNIVHFFSMLRKGNTGKQLVYYQAGIGTYTIPQVASPFTARVKQTVDMMLALNLNHHVMSGYEFLMQNYMEGDKICIFGFSRGAYTARALAGMIHKIGLIPRDNHQQVPFAYKMYTDDSEKGWDQSSQFKRAFSIDVDIEFVGVWDTVASVGLIPRRLPFVQSNTCIKTFRHAISLDEHRSKFKANLYQPTPDDMARGNDFKPPPVVHEHHHKTYNSKIVDGIVQAVHHTGSAVQQAAQHTTDTVKRVTSNDSNGSGSKDRIAAETEARYQARSHKTDALEVYFVGCHCDIGGGSVSNDTRHSLARIPLRWMIRQCFLANTGIQFQAGPLREIAGIDPDSLWPIVKTRPEALPIPNPPPILCRKEAEKLKRCCSIPVVSSTEAAAGDNAKGSANASASGDNNGSGSGSGSAVPDEVLYEDFLGEEEEDLRDALCPIYDQLDIAWWWWLLELWPVGEDIRLPNGEWTKIVGMNFGRPRVHRGKKDHKIKFHRTVKSRMEAMNYKPRMQYDCELEFVD